MNARMSVTLEPTEPPSTNNVNEKRCAFQSRCPAWKRGLDLSLIVLALPLWLPVMLLIALGIKIVSPGCIFFRQERVGYKGRRFMLFKFRSMRANVETGSHDRHCDDLIHANSPMTKLDAAGDPRIIPLGRLLRASGLDELPQIFNVLFGDMSLVGPRPCTPHEFECYEGAQFARFEALPGLTGYWQVHGKNRTTFSQMIDMDIHYVRSMSIAMDLSILAMTLPTVIGQVIDVHQRGKNRKCRSASSSTQRLTRREA